MEHAQSQGRVQHLAEPRRLDDADVRHQHERRVLALLGHASRHYQGALATAPEALQYLRERGVTRDSVRRFALGYARPVWRNLHRVVRDHDDDAFVDSGLVICKEGQSGDLRFDRHKAGIQSNRFVFKYGLRLLPELYAVYNPMPYEAAREMEVELAIGLREAGYGVWQA